MESLNSAPGMIGEFDRRYKKFELDSVDLSLYRLRIREKTAIERTMALIGAFLDQPFPQRFVPAKIWLAKICTHGCIGICWRGSS
jgi:hypothetical protein